MLCRRPPVETACWVSGLYDVEKTCIDVTFTDDIVASRRLFLSCTGTSAQLELYSPRNLPWSTGSLQASPNALKPTNKVTVQFHEIIHEQKFHEVPAAILSPLEFRPHPKLWCIVLAILAIYLRHPSRPLASQAQSISCWMLLSSSATSTE